jgi:cardiolipin synthase A/B
VPGVTCALGPDSAGTILSAVLRGARESIDAAMYEVGPSYAWLLADAARRGVRVRLVVDGHSGDGNRETAVTLAKAGAGCRTGGAGRSLFHPKVVLVDGATLAVGTGNLIWRDAPRDAHERLPPRAPPLRGTREWWLLLQGGRLVATAGRELRTAWQLGKPPPAAWRALAGEPAAARIGTPLPQVPPRNLTVAGRHLRLLWSGRDVHEGQLELIAAARRRVLVTTPYLHWRCAPVRSLVAELRAAEARGCNVAVLLGGAPAATDRDGLLASGIAARVMDPERGTRGHAKGVVADDSVLVSSANWSASGLSRNWEAALLVADRDAAGYFAAAWSRDWSAARPL